MNYKQTNSNFKYKLIHLQVKVDFWSFWLKVKTDYFIVIMFLPKNSEISNIIKYKQIISYFFSNLSYKNNYF